MSTDTIHTKTEFVARGHVFSPPETERSRLEHGFHVLSDERRDAVSVERTFPHHQRSPTGVQLLARLEKSEHRSAEEVAVTVEDFQRPEQDGRMHVMAAGVHHPLMDRSEFEPGRLRNRKRIHIGPQHERIPLAADARLRPLDTARTPVPATLRYSIPSCWSASATTFAVRCSSNESSGCWCRLLRHIMTWRNSPSASLMTVCFSLLSISPIGLPGPHTESPKSAASGTSAPRDTDSPYRHTEQQTPRILPPTKSCKEHASSKRYFSAAAFSPPPE